MSHTNLPSLPEYQGIFCSKQAPYLELECQQQDSKGKNNYICHVPCLKNSIAYDDFWYTYVK